jgi:Zn-dependent peptidase ImmA (M78 family)
MAAAIRKHWHVQPGPIDDLTALLERNNILVLQFDFKTDKLDGFFMPLPGGIVSIALNGNPAFSADRRRHTLAHEFGHALLEHCEGFPGREVEREAEEFASELLTPAGCIRNELLPPLTIARLKELKFRWKVSMGSLLYRAHSLETMNDSKYRRAWMFLSSQGYRRREPDCGVNEEQPALLKQLVNGFVSNEPNALGTLRLTAERFHNRYPWINLEGQSLMTPTAS